MAMSLEDEDLDIPRSKLLSFSTVKHVIESIKNSKKIIVITGAGISVSSGIPDFRSKDIGIYHTLDCDRYNIPSAELLFDYQFFKIDAEPFYKFAINLLPDENVAPSPCHNFIACLQARGKLLRNYTQNVDGLERKAGISKLIECHGSMTHFRCMDCKRKRKLDDVRQEVSSGTVAYCCTASCGGIMKPDITFFGETLPDPFFKAIKQDVSKCDLVIVIGTSLKVGGSVHLLLKHVEDEVPQVLINREAVVPPANISGGFDVSLLGECDHIAKYLCEALEWPLEPLRDESSAFSRSNDSFAKGKDVKGIAGTNSQSAQPTDERDMNGINRDSGPSLVLKRTRATRHSATSSDLKKDLSEVSMESIVTKLELTEVQRPPSDYCRTNSSRGLNDCFEGMSKRTKVVKGTPLLAPVIMLESVASSSSGAPSALPPSSSSSADSQSNIDSVDCWDCTSSAERIFNIKPRLNISTVKWLPPKNYGLLAVDTVLAADVLHESTKCSRKKRDRLDEKMIPVQKNISPRSKIQRSCDPSKLTGNKKAQLAIPIRAAYAVKVTTSGNRLSRMSQQKEQGPNTSRPGPCLAEDAVATSRGKRKVPIPGEKEPVVMKRSRGTRRMEEESTECSNIAAVDHKVEKSALGDFDGTTTKRKRGRPRKMPT